MPETIRIRLDGFVEWKKLGSVTEFEGVLISPGTYQGIDGKRITYSAEVLTKKSDGIPGTQVKYKHSDSAEAVVGFNTGVRNANGFIFNRGYIFDPKIAEEIARNPKKLGQSMEADVLVNDLGQAIDVTYLASAIGIESPACPDAVLQSIQEVRLSRPSEKDMLLDGSSGPSRAEFFVWLENTLLGAKVEDPSRVMSVLRISMQEPMKFAREKGQDQEDQGQSQKGKEGSEMSNQPTVAELTARLDALEREKVTLATENQTKLGAMQKERDDAKTAIKAINEARLSSMVADIQKVEKDFDSKTLLEGIEDFTVKERILVKYKATLERVSGRPDLPLSGGSPSDVQNRASRILKETFGISDIPSLVKRLTEST